MQTYWYLSCFDKATFFLQGVRKNEYSEIQEMVWSISHDFTLAYMGMDTSVAVSVFTSISRSHVKISRPGLNQFNCCVIWINPWSPTHQDGQTGKCRQRQRHLAILPTEFPDIAPGEHIYNWTNPCIRGRFWFHQTVSKCCYKKSDLPCAFHIKTILYLSCFKTNQFYFTVANCRGSLVRY